MSWLQAQVKENPQKLFIKEGEQAFSYIEISQMVQVYIKAFLQEGIQPRDRILIYLPGGIEMVEIILCCFEIGAIATPISRRLTKSERDAVIKTIQPRLIITNWSERDALRSVSYPHSCIEELPGSSGGCSMFINEYEKNPDDVCIILLTAGTTGIPKAVQLTYGNFEFSCRNWNNFLQFEPSDQFLCCLPLHHIGGLAVLVRALIYGFSVNLINEFKSEVILQTIQKYPVTIISLVPTMLKRILDIDGGLESMKTLRYILLGGGPSQENLLNTCIQQELPIIKVYGMTETCSGTFGLKLLEEPSNKLYAGRPFPGTEVWTENGEIYISGPMVMKGYVGAKETNGTHNSRDIGYLEDDILFLNIRRKDLIVSGGENINPQEVEECLMNVDGIADAAVVGKEDDEWGQKVTAYIVHKSVPLAKELLQRELRKSLAAFKIPKDYIRVPHIPRNELGKIVYEKLKFP